MVKLLFSQSRRNLKIIFFLNNLKKMKKDQMISINYHFND